MSREDWYLVYVCYKRVGSSVNDVDKRKNASAAKGEVKKSRCVSEIVSQELEQELTEWFADHSLFFDQTQKNFKDKQLKNAMIDG